ncbi:GNAT family N-acetyltransferase [Alteriqipengyuania sp.]
MNALFGEVFGEPETYCDVPPSHAYARELLSDPHMVLIVAQDRERIVGAIGGYILRKFEQERSELYIHDLAVAEDCRRQGIATRMIEEARRIARETGAWTVFVQADVIPEDEPARALYRKLAHEEITALHFDIAP